MNNIEKNLYEIYSDNLKLEKNDPNLTALGPQGRNFEQDLSSFIIHDKFNRNNL